MRSLVVSIGPSVALNVLLAGSFVVTLFGRTRRLRALALLGTLMAPLYALVLRRKILTWGAAPAEVASRLPGDEIIESPVWQSTRAISIAAPASSVWPWLAQMGQDRGGLYSFACLENLGGMDFHNADTIVPEWQHVAVGDYVSFAPNQKTMQVAGVEPGAFLVWRLVTPDTLKSAPVDATWAFILHPVDEHHTRLIQRFRFGASPRALALVYTLLVEIPHFVMEWGMLRGIRERAEKIQGVGATTGV